VHRPFPLQRLEILAATVLSGAAAYASGTNVGLAAARLKRDVEKG